MTYVGNQTIYSCREYEEVSILIQSLLGQDGQLKVFPEVANRGYFDVDYRQGRLVLKATRYIGLIPISEDIAIHVEPRTSISNLMRMIERAGLPFKGLSSFIRGYEEHKGAVDDPDKVYVEAFISALERASQVGILKRYVRTSTSRELRGRLLLGETISRYRSRGISHRAEFEVHDLTENNPENQIIKYTSGRLLKHLTGQLTRENQKKALRLNKLLIPFDLVNDAGVDSWFVARNTIKLIRGLPSTHRFYEPVLWLAYLISTNSGVVMERIGQAKFETVILDAANLFEQYIRTLIQGSSDRFGGCTIHDGNIRPVPLFTDNRIYTKPDYYFIRNNQALAVADAKYKPTISPADRYELLAFSEALGVGTAAFIVPFFAGQSLSDHLGTTTSGKTVKVIGINLAANDMEEEENNFIERLGKALLLC